MNATPFRNTYGAIETNGLVHGTGNYHYDRNARYPNGIQTVLWTEPGIRVTRLRLVSDPGFPDWDVSYCHGTWRGQEVNVCLPFSQLPKGNIKGFILDWARREGVYAKGIGILDDAIISKLC